MACPFFLADEPLSSSREARPVPLGDFYQGQCSADPTAYRPNETELRAWCNFGYARGACPRFPAAASADAVRFAVAADRDEEITVHFCLERDHRPGRHGSLVYLRGSGVVPPGDSGVNTLATAYVEAYRRRTR